MADDVTILIDDREFGFWHSQTIGLGLDVFSSVVLTAPFEPERQQFREVFRPFSFKSLEALIDGVKVFSGSMLTPVPNVSDSESTVEVTAYSKPAVLEDCGAPVDILPFEFKKVKLRAILEGLLEPFGIDLDLTGDDGSVFDQVALEVDEKIHGFLVKLVQQRGLILADSPDGTLICKRPEPEPEIVAVLEEGKPPISRVIPNFQPREYYSQITGFSPAKRGRKGTKWTEKNPILNAPLRPLNFRVDDTEDADTPTATRDKLARMFGNMVSYTIENIPTWRDPQGNLWKPNTKIQLLAPSAMIYRQTELLIRHVTLHRTGDTKTATLNVVLPGAFSGVLPEAGELPWDEPSASDEGLQEVFGQLGEP